MKRVVVGLIVLVLLIGTGGATALLLFSPGGVVSSAGPPPPPRPDLPLPSTDPGLAAFVDQELDWQPCPKDTEHDCAKLTVPLDYSQPGGRTIQLALLRVPARKADQKVGALVVNPGGPGAPGTSYAAAGASVFGKRLLDHFDLVGFDPRGTGDSAPVDCLSDVALDAYLAEDPDPETPAERAQFRQSELTFGSGCVALSGDLVGHVSTVEAARDLDVLRAALDQPRLDFFGASYGTKLGATYAQLFPRHVGRMVLDGAIDLSLAPRALDLQQATGFETALRSYVANCVESGSCFLGDTTDAGVARIQEFLASMESGPLPTSGERELTVGNAYYGVILPLYNRRYWLLLSAALRQAFAGDGTSLLLLADAYASRGPTSYLHNSIEANLVINCLDQPRSVPVSRVPALLPAFEKASPTFGRVFAYGLTGCGGLPLRAAEAAPHTDAKGAPPIVVIGTTRDPATPLRWAQALAGQLASGVLITRDGDGHTGYHADNVCVDQAVEGYLVDGSVPADDLSC